MAVHPPAMGGKTAWGVSEVVSRPTDDPDDIIKMRKLQSDFSKRENDRLERLKDMETRAGSLLEVRKARRLEYQPAMTNGDDFRKKQDEILRKMQDARERKRLEKKEQRKREGAAPGAGKKKRRQKEAASDSSSSSSESSGSSSSSASGAQRQAGAAAEAAAGAAEARGRAAAAEATRQAEARRRAEEAEAKRQEEAKRKAEEAEAKRRVEEAEAKQKAANAEGRRKLFQREKRKSGDGDARRETVAGGFYKGQRVLAAQDITVRGSLVVRAGAAGTVVGPSESDPVGRIAVRFLQREDTGLGNLNVVPREIKKG